MNPAVQPLRLNFRGLLVEEILGEPMRFRVRSSTGKGCYVVDLESRWPQPDCQCRNAVCVRWPEFKRTKIVDPCKHGLASMCLHSLRESARTLVHEAQQSE